ncbi:hypothetical protein GE115_06115 [Agromyces sp. CFH 90414]|uniref:Carboxypeptidase regulatory-like domain-containing protein n=1 Tax=Agromyces agglutinans TaxID=2662258 RepID=A0A6I2F4D4_9MICO|nr:hypothetical protein [Agromyces agglutinans]MRG59449.1 hypothetical protein [Agromyces agglutinans]
MKRPFSALVVAVLGAGLAIGGTAAPAAATEGPAQEIAGTSCLVLDVDLTGYATQPEVPAVTEERVVTPAVAEVSHTDYQYEKQKLVWFQWKGTGEYRLTHKWAGDDTWYDWDFYKFTGATQKHVEVEAKDAVTETVVVTPAVPANPTPNTVTVTIDGVVVAESVAFGADFQASYALADKFSENAYTVSVAGYQGQGTGEFSGTVAPCALGDFAAAASIDVSVCEAATVTVTNHARAEHLINATYSAVVYQDGKYLDALAVFEDTDVVKSYALPAGAQLVVRSGPAHGDVELARATAADCDPAGPVDPEPGDPELKVTGDFVAGGDITVEGTGFAANTEYELELHSTPQPLGLVTTDAEGAFAVDTAIPAATPAGAHEIVVLLEGETIATTPVTIAAATPSSPTTPTAGGNGTAATAPNTAQTAKRALAETGFDATAAMAALALLVLGGTAVTATRLARSRA